MRDVIYAATVLAVLLTLTTAVQADEAGKYQAVTGTPRMIPANAEKANTMGIRGRIRS